VDDAHDVVFDGAKVVRVPGAAGHGNVLRESASAARAYLIRRSRPGIERIAVNRCVEDILAFFEEMLRSVAVMDVEVEDEHALDSVLLAQPFSDAGDGVEEAEPHGLNPLGVMAGRAGDDKRSLRLTQH